MKGFTLLEVLLVIALLGVLLAGMGSLASNTFPKNQLTLETDLVVSTLRRAQTRSISGYQDGIWGVYFQPNTMTLFKGEEYLSRDSVFDERHVFESGITMGGLSEIVFEARHGQTQDVGTVTITQVSTGDTNTLIINENGRIQK